MALLSEMPLLAHPGENFNYSVSLDVLGAVIEKVTGLGLAEYLDKQFLIRWGWRTHTSYWIPRSKNQLCFRRNQRFGPDGNPIQPIGKVKSGPNAIDWKIGAVLPAAFLTRQPTWYSGGGGLISSANDYARYLSMIAGRGTVDGTRY